MALRKNQRLTGQKWKRSSQPYINFSNFLPRTKFKMQIKSFQKLFVTTQLRSFGIYCLIFFLAVSSCKEKPAVRATDIETGSKDTVTASVPEVDSMEYNASRTVWQKPASVISKLGDLSDKVVADIGAGTGYFSFRLAFHAHKVIAVDIDTNALQTISAYIPKLPV